MMWQHLYLIPYLLVQAYQHLWLVRINDIYQRFTYVNHIHHSSSRLSYVLRVATISHDLVTDLKGGGYVVTRTSHPIERTQLAHVLLEYGWQNTRLNPDLIGFNNYSYDFVSQATESVRTSDRSS